MTLTRSSVTGLTLISGGSAYTPNGTGKALGFSGGGGTGATGTFDVVGGVIGNLQLTAPGTAFTTAPTVSFPGVSGGTGASATATLGTTSFSGTTTGQVISISIPNSATNGPYATVPNITIGGGGGSGAAATAVRTGGNVQTPTVTNGGDGYISLPAVTITDATGTGSGAAATSRLGLNTAAINSGGTGYAVGNVLTITGGSATTTAQLTVTSVSSGVITGVSVSRAGVYTSVAAATGTVTGGAGTGATFILRWQVVQIVLGTPGTLYSSPSIAIAASPPGGTQATATATATVIRVTSATMITFGSGYTSVPTVTVDAPASGVTATALAVIYNQACVGIDIAGTWSGGVNPNTSRLNSGTIANRALLCNNSNAPASITLTAATGFVCCSQCVVPYKRSWSMTDTFGTLAIPFYSGQTEANAAGNAAWASRTFSVTGVPSASCGLISNPSTSTITATIYYYAMCGTSASVKDVQLWIAFILCNLDTNNHLTDALPGDATHGAPNNTTLILPFSDCNTLSAASTGTVTFGGGNANNLGLIYPSGSTFLLTEAP